MKSRLPDYFTIGGKREVIKPNFGGSYTPGFFCQRFRAESVSEAIRQSEEAAMAFMKDFQSFRHMPENEARETLIEAVERYNRATLYFLDNTDEFVGPSYFQEVLRLTMIKERRAYLKNHPPLRLVGSED